MSGELAFAYSKTISSHFASTECIFICLYPFYREVFSPHYSWRSNLKQTYPLLETLSWGFVSQDIDFNSLNRLAKGVMERDKVFQTELSEYCEQEKLLYPDYLSDSIPEVILIPFLRFLKNKGDGFLEIRKNQRFPNAKQHRIELSSTDEFNIYKEICNEIHFVAHELELLLPDHDFPYCLITGNRNRCQQLIDFGKMECISVDSTTRFDWWNQGDF